MFVMTALTFDQKLRLLELDKKRTTMGQLTEAEKREYQSLLRQYRNNR